MKFPVFSLSSKMPSRINVREEGGEVEEGGRGGRRRREGLLIHTADAAGLGARKARPTNPQHIEIWWMRHVRRPNMARRVYSRP